MHSYFGRYFLIVILTWMSEQAFSQEITSETLIKEFLSGRLFVFNGYALNRADSTFFEELVRGNIMSAERLDSVAGLTSYGTIGASGVLKIQVENLAVLGNEQYRVVDSSVLKHFNEMKKSFYFIDGLPNNDIYYALSGLINKKIKEVSVIGPSQAQALWGKQAKNGAIMINTDGKVDLPMK